MSHNHFTNYAYDWAGPLSSILLGFLMLDHNYFILTKEIVVIVSIIIGLAANGLRLWKEFKSKKDKEDE